MYQAGEGWQYGKRKISAMSNEEFNKLTPELVMEKQAIVLKNSLQTIEKSMNDMTPMIGTIIQQYGDFIREIIKNIPAAAANIFQQSGQDPNAQITNVRLSGGSQQEQRGVEPTFPAAIKKVPEAFNQVSFKVKGYQFDIDRLRTEINRMTSPNELQSAVNSSRNPTQKRRYTNLVKVATARQINLLKGITLIQLKHKKETGTYYISPVKLNQHQTKSLSTAQLRELAKTYSV